MFERLSQVILIILGALALAVLVMGLAISCRQQPEPSETLPSLTPGGPSPTPLPANPTITPTPTPLAATATPTPDGAIVAPDGATATPTPSGATATPLAVAPLPAPGVLTPGTTIQHTVIRGEWLLQIARCYGTTYSGV